MPLKTLFQPLKWRICCETFPSWENTIPLPNSTIYYWCNLSNPKPFHERTQPIIYKNIAIPEPSQNIYKAISHKDITNHELPFSVDEIVLGLSYSFFASSAFRAAPLWCISQSRQFSEGKGLYEVTHLTIKNMPLNWRSVPHNEPIITRDNYEMPILKPCLTWLWQSLVNVTFVNGIKVPGPFF